MGKDNNTREYYISLLISNLPVLRAKLGVTQGELAERIGMTRQTLTCIENGSRKLTWNNYLAICFVFDNNPATSALMGFLGICPGEIRSYVGGA